MNFVITLQFVSSLCLITGSMSQYWGPYYSSNSYSPYMVTPLVSPWGPYSSPAVTSNTAPVASSCPACVTPQYPVCGLNSYKDDFQTFPSLCYMQLSNCNNVNNVYEMQHYGQCLTPATNCTCPAPVICPAPTICPTCPPCPILPPAPLPTANTASGYQFISGFGNYKFYPAATSWPAAFATCLAEGAYLVVFDSEAENAAVLKIFQTNQASISGATYKTFAWIGYKESAAKSNDYFSIMGDTLSCSVFKRWNGAEPNSPTLGDFGWMSSADGGLGDESVAAPTTLAFICERH